MKNLHYYENAIEKNKTSEEIIINNIQNVRKMLRSNYYNKETVKLQNFSVRNHFFCTKKLLKDRGFSFVRKHCANQTELNDYNLRRRIFVVYARRQMYLKCDINSRGRGRWNTARSMINVILIFECIILWSEDERKYI